MINQSSSVGKTETIKVELILDEAKKNYSKGRSNENLYLSYLFYKTALLEETIPVDEKLKIYSNCCLILDKLSQEQFYVNDNYYFISKVLKLYNNNNNALSDNIYLHKFCCRISQNFFKNKANYMLLYLTKELRQKSYAQSEVVNLINSIKAFLSKEIDTKKEKYFSQANSISSFLTEYNTLFTATDNSTAFSANQYVISNKWFKSLHNFVQALSSTEDITSLFNVDNVKDQWCNVPHINETNAYSYYCGEVNNLDIVEYRKQWETAQDGNSDSNRIHLRKGLIKDEDYVIVNQDQFEFIKKYFGIQTNMIITYNNNEENEYIDLPIIIASSYLNSYKKCLNEKRYLRIHKSSSLEDIKDSLQQCLYNYFSIHKDEATSSSSVTMPPIYSFELYSTTNMTNKNKIILTLAFIVDAQRCHFDYATNLQLKHITSFEDILTSLSSPKSAFVAVITHSKDETPLISLPALTNELTCFKCNDTVLSSEQSEICKEHPTLCSKHYCSNYCLDVDEEHKLFHTVLTRLLHMQFNFNELLSSSLEQFTSHHKSAGLTGLDNIGNTCFMNSALQCLSHCEYLTLYFLNNSYKHEINSNTKYGSGGEIANGYGSLVRELWLGNSSHMHPREFRNIFIRFAKQFAGFSQHDSHEMLTFMLDGLHEDLNRNKDKPYIEMVDQQESETDAEASERFWMNMLRRDNSIIVDLFYGQYKSTLQCPVCNKISITYDPFMCLGVPITSAFTADVLVIDATVNECKVVKMNVNEKDTFGDFVKKNIDDYSNKDVIGVLCGDDMSFKRNMQCNDKLYDMISVHSDLKMVVYEYKKHQLEGKKILFITPTVVNDNKTEEPLFYPKPFVYEETNTVSELYNDIACYYKCYYGNVKCESEVGLVGENTVTVINHGECDRNIVEEEKGNKLVEEKVEEDEEEKVKDNIKRGGGGKKNKRKQEKRNKRKEKKLRNQQKQTNTNDTEPPQETNDNNTNKSQTQTNQPTPSTNDDISTNANTSINTSIASLPSHETNSLPELTILNNLTQPSRNKYPCDYCNSFKCNNCPFPFKPSDTISTLFSSQSKPRSFLLCLKVPSSTLPVSKAISLYPSVHEVLLSSSLHFKRSHTLTTCIESFLQKEILDENNMWYCPSCKEHRQAFKQIQLMKLPRYLIIQLKRFKNETSFFYGNSKNSEEVDFPVHGLNMNKYIQKGNSTANANYTYDLFAISQHYGISFGGHYTAFINNKGVWYDFDDETVRQVREGSLVSPNAYLLFYKLKE